MIRIFGIESNRRGLYPCNTFNYEKNNATHIDQKCIKSSLAVISDDKFRSEMRLRDRQSKLRVDWNLLSEKTTEDDFVRYDKRNHFDNHKDKLNS